MTKDKKSGGAKGKKKHVHKYDQCRLSKRGNRCLVVTHSKNLSCHLKKNYCKCGKKRLT